MLEPLKFLRGSCNALRAFLYSAFLAFLLTTPSLGFKEWDYNVDWAVDTSVAPHYMSQPRNVLKATWLGVWETPSPGGTNPNSAPRPRYGHSLTQITTDVRSVYKGRTIVLMFGGRDNEKLTEHIPKTYDVKKVDGVYVFTVYDQRPVNPCNDREVNETTGDSTYYTKAERIAKGCDKPGAYNASSQITVGVIYNDVWAYVMCENKVGENYRTPTGYTAAPNRNPDVFGYRYWDTPCQESGWLLLHPGAREGGCVIQLGILVCNVPSERYDHGAVTFADGTMYVYGGFSQRCVDYCDDLW